MELALRDTSKWIVVRSNAETQTYVVYTTDDKRLCVTQELMGSRPNHSFTEVCIFFAIDWMGMAALLFVSLIRMATLRCWKRCLALPLIRTSHCPRRNPSASWTRVRSEWDK